MAVLDKCRPYDRLKGLITIFNKQIIQTNVIKKLKILTQKKPYSKVRLKNV